MSVFYGRALTAWGGGSDISAPIIGKDFNWTGGDGTYQVRDDWDGNWRIKFLSSGTFTPLKDMLIDAFLVGGGGGGGSNDPNENATSGGNSTAFGATATGGSGAYYNSTDDIGRGGNGGSGGGGAFITSSAAPSSGAGSGGSDGSNGTGKAQNQLLDAGGTGQGTTTREFGEAIGDLYSGGGGGGSNSKRPSDGGAGGEGGGGRGGYDLSTANAPTAGAPNSGGGGGGNNYKGCGGGGGYTRTEKSIVLAANNQYPIVVGAGGSGATRNQSKFNGCDGGSGIVIIRNHRSIHTDVIEGILQVGQLITFDGMKWRVVHNDGNLWYLAFNTIEESVKFGDDNTYSGSNIANRCVTWMNAYISAKAKNFMQDVTVSNVTGKVFIPTYDQVNGGFSYYNSNSNRIATNSDGTAIFWWTSTGSTTDSAYTVSSSGVLQRGTGINNQFGFRPHICIEYEA